MSATEAVMALHDELDKLPRFIAVAQPVEGLVLPRSAGNDPVIVECVSVGDMRMALNAALKAATSPQVGS